jgi:hypothetical protein
MLTDTETKKLMDRGPVRDKANDFIVRRKFKKWLDDLHIVFVVILGYLPDKQVKKLVNHKHIIDMMDILLHLLSTMTGPIVEVRKNEFVLIRPYSPPVPATQEEVWIRGYTKTMALSLFRHLSPEDARDVIQTELSRNHPEYALKKKRA